MYPAEGIQRNIQHIKEKVFEIDIISLQCVKQEINHESPMNCASN